MYSDKNKTFIVVRERVGMQKCGGSVKYEPHI